VARPSHVLLATGADTDRARSSLRFSLGHTSTDADVDAVLDVIGPVVERARRAGLTRGERERASQRVPAGEERSDRGAEEVHGR
jgi:hypothetical protein